MVEEGNYIRWSHKSIQEYFAARYICTSGNQVNILLNYIQKSDFTSHLNLIMLCADIDRAAFKQSIAKWIAETLLKEFDSLYVTGFENISNDLMAMRKELIVGKKAFFIRVRLPDDNFRMGPNHHITEIQKVTKAIEAKIGEVEGNFKYMNHTMMLSNPGVCIINTEIANIIEHLYKITDLPFIDTTIREVHTAEDSLDQQLSCQQINEDPLNPVNEPSNFLLINQLLQELEDWKFNKKNAIEFLVTLEEESKAQHELKDW